MTDTPALTVTFLKAGSCRQKARLAGRLESGSIDFHAVFLHVRHPEHGDYLIDTGYGPRYMELLRKFPERVLGWLLPTRLATDEYPDLRIRQAGLDPDALRGILLSHFHADHIGGVSRFPGVPLVARRAAYESASRGGHWSQVARGFVSRLLPDDLSNHVRWIDEPNFVPGTGVLSEFLVHDYWQDGSLLWVDLPGHADHHVGFLLRTAEGPLFYIVDACWDVEALLAARRLPWLGRHVQHNAQRYEATQQRLRDFHHATGIPLLACHCHRTLPRVVTA